MAGFLLIIQTSPPNDSSLDIPLPDPLSCWDVSLTWGGGQPTEQPLTTKNDLALVARQRRPVVVVSLYSAFVFPSYLRRCLTWSCFFVTVIVCCPVAPASWRDRSSRWGKAPLLWFLLYHSRPVSRGLVWKPQSSRPCTDKGCSRVWDGVIGLTFNRHQQGVFSY